MSKEQWCPIEREYPDLEAALGDYKALKVGGIQCELRKASSDSVPKCPPNAYIIWVLLSQKETAEQILIQGRKQKTITTSEFMCEQCGEQASNVHLTLFDENGNKTLRNLCQECYQQSDLPQ